MDHLHDHRVESDFSKSSSNGVSSSSNDIDQTATLSPPPLQLKIHSLEKKAAETSAGEKTTQLKTANGEGSEKPADDSAMSNNTGLPNQLKSGIESLSGFSLADVNVHRNSDKPAQLKAHAYAQGKDIHLGPGQEKHLPHEAWHVVQQKQGRVQPTMQMKAVSINDDTGLEKEADVMGAKAMNTSASDRLLPLQSATASSQVIQQRNWGKTIANIASFGIRKLIVHINRANQAPPAGPAHVPQDPEDEFVDAYEKSRYYHSTNNAETKTSIEDNGLLNFQDREDQLPEQVYGMSRLGGEFEGDEKKGVFLGPSRKWMTDESMTNNVVRSFLPSDRTVKNNTRDGTEVPSHELYRDGKFPGAFITKDSIQADNVTGQNMLELLDAGDAKVDSIIQTVATQYEGPPPSLEEMKDHMRAAIMKRRLSNAPLRDINDELMKEDGK